MPPPMYQFRGNDRGERSDRGRSRPPREFSFRHSAPKTAARPLLQTHRETTPEMLGGSKNEEDKSRKFLSVDDITDSDEAEMDVSSADDDEAAHPRKKRAVEVEEKPVAAAPKWSNPDPYTALPPPDESQNKRKDVVKLIRKARIQSTTPQQPEVNNAVVSNEDFISFGTEYPEENEAPHDAPRGPKQEYDAGGDQALGNRKRTINDEIKGPARSGPPQQYARRGSILEHWLPSRHANPTPWLDGSEPSSLHLGTR